MNLLNSRQLASLWGGIAAIALMGLMPPWREAAGLGQPLTYAPIFNPPISATGVNIDYGRLSVQWLIAIAVTGGLLASYQKIAQSGSSVKTSDDDAAASAGVKADISRPGKDYKAHPEDGSTQAGLKKVRTLAFPAQSIGELLVESDDDQEYWEFFAHAAGSVAVPFNRRVQLELDKSGNKNISHLSGLPADAFYSLDFSGSEVLDADLKHVAHFTELRELDLSDTSVTDLGIKSLSGLSKLKKVWLDNTEVTDKGLEDLSNHREIEKISLIGTHIDTPVAQSLLKIFPGKCELVLEENG